MYGIKTHSLNDVVGMENCFFEKKRNIKKERESEYVSERERERERVRDGSVSSLSREGGYKVERDRE